MRVGDRLKSMLKAGFFFLFLMLCISAYERDRETHFTTVSLENDMDYLNSQIETSDGVSAHVRNRVETEIQRLPIKLWKQYFYDGGELTIVNEKISNSEENVVGSFSIINDVEMFITINEDYIEYSLCHEFSHYLYYLVDEKSYLGYQLMLSEKDDIWKNLMSCNEHFYSESEYFAEAGKLYFRNQLDPNRYPYTVKFFDVITEQFY